MALIQFQGVNIKFDGKTIKVAAGSSITPTPDSKFWAFDVNSTVVENDPTYAWQTYANGKITLNEPTNTMPTYYPYSLLKFGETINLEEMPNIELISTATNHPTASLWFVDANNNVSDYVNLGKLVSSEQTLALFKDADSSIHGSLGTGDEKTLAKTNILTLCNKDGFDATQVTGLRICISNWYQENPTWKQRNKSITIVSMKIEE